MLRRGDICECFVESIDNILQRVNVQPRSLASHSNVNVYYDYDSTIKTQRQVVTAESGAVVNCCCLHLRDSSGI